MTNELPNDAPIENANQEDVAKTAESGAELATATEEKQDKSNDGAQDAANKAINKQHAKFREEERKRIDSDKRAKLAETELAELKANQEKVNIPEIPDSYDEDFESKLQAREEAIRLKATQDAKTQYATDQQTATKNAAAETEKTRVNNLITDYTARISTLGLSADEIRLAGDTVVANGIDGQVAEYILGDEDGPLITRYLSKNPIIQDELRGLSTIDAAMKINSVVRQAAVATKTQASETPDPTEIINGSGTAEKSDGGITYS